MRTLYKTYAVLVCLVFLLAANASTSMPKSPITITITGVAGSVCSPAATGILKQKCPADVPAGCTIKPAAILQDQSGDKYCALGCAPSLPIKDQKLADAVCGVTNMSCKPISGVGICTYDA